MISNFYLLASLLALNLQSIHSYVVLPVNILPKENYKSDYEANSPKDIMLKEFITSFYTEYEITTKNSYDYKTENKRLCCYKC